MAGDVMRSVCMAEVAARVPRLSSRDSETATYRERERYIYIYGRSVCMAEVAARVPRLSSRDSDGNL